MKIRTMNETDLDYAGRAIRAEGWRSESLEMVAEIVRHDPEGSFIATRQGERIGMCATAAYANHGFIGLLIVNPGARGAFAGPRLLAESMDHLQRRGVKNLHLDGVEGAAPYYASVGFVKVCRSLRFVGSLAGEKHARVRPMEERDMDAVCRLDGRAFKDDRGFFLKRKRALFPRFSKVFDEGGRITGYIQAHAGDGLVGVGPWVASGGADQALALLKAMALGTGALPIRIGILERNETAVALIRSLGVFRETPFSWRMCRGDSPELGLSEMCYAVGSPAKG